MHWNWNIMKMYSHKTVVEILLTDDVILLLEKNYFYAIILINWRYTITNYNNNNWKRRKYLNKDIRLVLPKQYLFVFRWFNSRKNILSSFLPSSSFTFSTFIVWNYKVEPRLSLRNWLRRGLLMFVINYNLDKHKNIKFYYSD